MNMRKFKRRINRIIPNGRQLVIGVPFIWLFLFFMLPFFIVLKISFAEADVAIPPYTEIYTYAEQKLQPLLNLGNYAMLAGAWSPRLPTVPPASSPPCCITT